MQIDIKNMNSVAHPRVSKRSLCAVKISDWSQWENDLNRNEEFEQQVLLFMCLYFV